MKIASLEIDLLANIARLQQDMRRAEGTVERAMANIERQVQRVQRAFGALGLGVGVGALISLAERLSDAWQGMENRLRLVTGTQRQLARATDDVYRIAMRTSSGLDATAQVYQRFAQNAGALGLSMGQVAALSETVSKSVAVSGASAAAADAALMQFGQALASGVLRGEEFNSIIEQTPSLMQAMATGMGVPLGSMRKLAQEGKLTGDVIVQSLMKAADSVDAQFNTRVKTIAQSWTDLNTALTRYVGEMTRAGGISSTVAEAITSVAHNLDGIGRALIFIAATAIPAAVKALWSLTSAMLAVPGMQLVKVLGVAAGALLAFHDKIKVPEAALQGLGATWDFVGAAFSSGSKVILGALDSLGTGVQSFFNLFASAPAAAASNLQDPFQKAALAIAGVFDQIYAGFTGNLSAMGAALRAMVENGKTAFHSFAEDAVAALRSVADAINSVFKTEISISPYVGPENREYLSIIDEAKRAFEEGQKVLGMRDALVQRIAESTLEGLNDAFDIPLVEAHTAAIKNNGDGAGKANSAYQTLIASLRTKIDENRLEIATGDKASEADKLRIKVIQELAAGKLKLTTAQKQLVDMLLKGLKASESELNISKMVAAARKKEIDLTAEAVKAAYDEARSNEQAAATYGMTASEVQRLTLARLEDQLAQAESLNLTDEQVKALELLIEAHRRNMAALGSIDFLEKQKAAWEEWKGTIEEVFRQVGQSLTDRLFEGGKSAREMIKDLFKTLTLRLAIQPVMQGLQGWVTQGMGNMLGYSNPAQQGGGGANTFGMAQNASSLYSAMTGGISTTMGNGISWLGAKLGSEALSAFGLGMSGAAGAAGTAAGIQFVSSGLASTMGAAAAPGAYTMASVGFEAALGGAGAAGAAGAAGGAAGAAGTAGAVGTVAGGGAGAAGAALAAAAPWVLGGLAVAGLLGGMDFGGETRKGGTYVYDHRTGRAAHDGGWIKGMPSDQVSGAVNSMVDATAQQINSILQAIDPNVYLAKLHGEVEDSEKDRGGVSSGGVIVGAGGLTPEEVAAQTYRAGQPLSHQYPDEGGIQFGTFQRGQGFGPDSGSLEEMIQYLAVDLQQTTIQALQSVSHILPETLKGMVEGIDAKALGVEQSAAVVAQIQAVVQGVTAFQSAVEQLPFENLKGLAFDAAASLIQLAGGIDGLLAAEQSYIQNFYSDAERTQMTWDAIGRVLGDVNMAVPETREQFRAVKESLDLNTESGRKAYAALMSVQDAFASVTLSADELAAAAARAAEEQRRAAEQAQQALWNAAVSAGEAAYSALTRAVAAEKTRMQRDADAIATALRTSISAASTTVNELTGLTGRLTSTVQRMAGQLDEGRSRAWAQDRIDRALSVAKLTGVMPQGADFEQALQLVAQPSEGLFSSFEDYQADFLRTAHTVSELNELAEGQLSTEKRALKAMEDQLATSQQWYQSEMERLDLMLEQERTALDIAMGTHQAVLSIPEAIAGVTSAIQSLAAAQAAAAKPAPGSGGGGGAGGGVGNASYVDYMTGNPDLMAAYLAAGGGNYMPADQWAQQHWDTHGQYEDRDIRLRSFDVGTNRIPYDMLAMVHQDERIIPAADNRVLMQMLSRGSNQGNEIRLLQQEIRELRLMMERKLDGVERNTGDTARTNRQMAEERQIVQVEGPVATVLVEDRTA